MNKTILITGSTDGIGKLTALKLAKEGHTIYVHGRSEVKVNTTIAEIKETSNNKNIKGFVADFSDLEAVSKMAEQIKKEIVITTFGMDMPEEAKAIAEKENKTVSNILVHSSAKDMNTLKGMLESGAIKPNIYKTFAFEDMADAHREVEKGRTVGKVIVTI